MTKKAKLSKNIYQYYGIESGYIQTFKRFPIKTLENKKTKLEEVKK